jgi:hypothetical protein
MTSTIPIDSSQNFIGAMASVEVDQDSNLAGSSREFDERICKHVRERVTAFREVMIPLYRRWRLTYWMLAGNTIDQAGPMEVHIPELHKMIETIVPRIEEALLDPDPWFRVKARRETDQDVCDTIGAYLDWQLDQAGFRDLIQGSIRDLLVTQVCAWKFGWDRRVEKRPHRERTLNSDGTISYRRTMKRKKTYDGPTINVIDPFDFIIDPKSTDPQTARYVGEVCWYTFEELKQFEAMGFIKNVDKLKDVKTKDSQFDRTADTYKINRSPIDRFRGEDARLQRVDGEQELYEVCNLCCKFQLTEDGEFEESILTVANGTVCLAALPNFYDYKMRPYATARSSRNAHDFFGIGVLDNAVRLNQHLDRAHAIGLRAFEVGGQPMIFAENDDDIPSSLYKAQPFKVIKGAGRVQMTTVPEGVLRNIPTMLGMLSRDIEETVGSFRIQMGQESSAGTLGQSTLSLQEGNRRMRGLIRNITSLLNQTLKVIYKQDIQFVTEEDEFRVLGKRAAILRTEFGKVSPETFMEDVDFEFVGLESLHTYGLKATALQQILGVAGPLIVQNGSNVDQLQILHELFSALLGGDTADRIVKLKSPRDTRMTQEEENLHISKGRMIEVDPADPHGHHIMVLLPLYMRMKSDPNVDPKAMFAAEKHMREHEVGYRRDREQQMVQARDQAAQAAPGAPEAGGTQSPDGRSRSPLAGGLSAAMNSQPKGQTPGPAAPGRLQQMGRAEPPIPQMQNNLG